MGHEIKLVDAFEGLRGLESESVGLILTDPPYASLEKWRDMGTTTRLKKSKQSSNAWFPTIPNDRFPEFFRECYRVLRNNTDCYVMCDEETADVFKPMMKDVGFELRKSLIWWKVGKEVEVPCTHCGQVLTHINTPGTPGMGYPFRSQWEMILLGRKGKRPAPEDKSIRNVLPIPWIKSTTAYPTQKPSALCEILIKQSSSVGDLVLDPFAGSGSCGEAAYNLSREFLGFDVKQEALDYFYGRKKQWGLQGEVGQELPGVVRLFGRR